MTFDELDTTASCLLSGDDTRQSPCGSIAATVISLEIIPSSASVDTGSTFPYVAIAGMSDGTNVVVTTSCVWWVSDETVAYIGAGTGIAGSLLEPPLSGGFSEGDVTVYASYQGLQAQAELRCFSVCSSTALDVMMVLDRSASMGRVWDSGETSISLVGDAVKVIINTANATRDQLGIVSYAGNIYLNDTGVYATAKESTLDCQLTSDMDTIATAVDEHYAVRGPCDGTSIRHCQTGIGGGLQDAVTELASSRHRAGAQKVIILLTDGAENIDNPVPEVIATTAKNDGIIIVTVGLNVPSTFQSRLTSLATPGKAYNIERAEDIAGIFSTIAHVLCMDGDAYYGYVYAYALPGEGAPVIAGADPGDISYNIPVGYLSGFRENPGDPISITPEEEAYVEGLIDEAVTIDRANMENAALHPDPSYSFVSVSSMFYVWGYFENSWGSLQNTGRRHLRAEAAGDFDTKLHDPYGWTAMKTITYHPSS